MTTSMVTDQRMTTSGNFSQGGNGKYKPLRTKKQGSQNNSGMYDPFNPSYDRMRFKNSQDPIYYVFDCIENRPLSTLTKEFVKDSIFEVVNFVSKVVG